MDKKQGPTVQHRELYSISWDKPQWKDKKRMYVCVYKTESLCCIAEINRTLEIQYYTLTKYTKNVLKTKDI